MVQSSATETPVASLSCSLCPLNGRPPGAPPAVAPALQLLYNLETAEELCELRGNASAIVDVVFSQVG